MCPLDKFGRLYVGETERNKRPLNALKAAIERYIEIRQNWIENGSSGFGWRGSFAKGKLFFNRAKTESNLALMRRIIEVIDDSSMRYRAKLEDIRQFKSQLTSGGQGRRLIETFESTALSAESAYLPKSSGLEESIYIKEGSTFRRDRTLGRGAYGKASRFASPEGRSVVVKDMHDAGVTRKELEKEVALFGEVYDHMGRQLFGDNAESRVIRHSSKDDPRAKITLPEVPGQNLRAYCRNYQYNEEDLFFSVFNFLERLHKELQIAHCDCHAGNVMVLDQLNNVFFIDYGLAYKYYDPTGHDRNKKSEFFDGIRQDLVFIVLSILETRHNLGIYENIKVKTLIQKFNLKRWINWGFRPAGSNSYTLEQTLYTKVNASAEYVGLRARLRL
ncbi:hypothetical protein AAEX28_10905 [Lentisphaerota bacterium WC36G]|nr:hypothetical protein LJT99_13745 [Lentisphaerae bacterium WC36]